MHSGLALDRGERRHGKPPKHNETTEISALYEERQKRDGTLLD
jgi:hypothetical protein